MRERRTEVEQLKQRISELENTAHQGTICDFTADTSSCKSPEVTGTYGRGLSNTEAFDGGDVLTEYAHTVSCPLRPGLTVLSLWLVS